jgi:pilus assembly protein Flp/PilA
MHRGCRLKAKFTLRESCAPGLGLRDRVNFTERARLSWSSPETAPNEAISPRRSLFMKNLIARFAKDESGATAIEYGLIAAGIALAIITVVNNLGTALNSKFTSISTSLK